jgi:hypothetical protein
MPPGGWAGPCRQMQDPRMRDCGAFLLKQTTLRLHVAHDQIDYFEGQYGRAQPERSGPKSVRQKF